ncbi:hypothetical protein BDN72DRAFT_857535 [Pluteus cervinus]|uniref:Uncharacterized protein n=1 Tax=Pluteus cervinus TaxID=181527 RepID=A0ACD3AUV7_9AGAR|nr:hypothetical protein BDN72DRAFT_857535 [Pluteus cervinus]
MDHTYACNTLRYGHLLCPRALISTRRWGIAKFQSEDPSRAFRPATSSAKGKGKTPMKLNNLSIRVTISTGIPRRTDLVPTAFFLRHIQDQDLLIRLHFKVDRIMNIGSEGVALKEEEKKEDEEGAEKEQQEGGQDASNPNPNDDQAGTLQRLR